MPGKMQRRINMKIADANIILRYIMQDDPQSFKKASELIENNEIFILTEVLAEIVYVLEKFYKVERVQIKTGLLEFLENDTVSVENYDIVKTALEKYAEIKIDFVDCVLYAYSKINHAEILTFDKKLLGLIERI